ncbi:patatin-like phospholipase family protein [Komagataeibacter oboediens]|uniref:patatin-like phospholipase family protein n=1 Tax=Komagataeibacter oboediens TaxID=65958 RepID=UPI001C2D2C43|nr:patatin-like phospholipase family protein [Komagataeibacter oboediens]
MGTEDRGNPFRVLCIDGGGMRGIYSAAYLDVLASRYASIRKVEGLDLGKGFDLICGTSTGAILACALAWDISLDKVIELYRKKGVTIFPEKVPGSLWGLVSQWFRRRKLNERGAKGLEEALDAELKDVTVRDVWDQRGIGLAIPAVEMGRHRAWVFKTPHLPNSRDRDGGYTLTQVCLASTAAPIFRSMAWLPNFDTKGAHVFVDGGLWANNPVLVGLIDALEVTNKGDEIEIYCLGTCPPPSGDIITKEEDIHRGFREWRVGALAAGVGISAQQYAYDNMAIMIGRHVDRKVRIIRFPKGDVAGALLEHLDLDETRETSMEALISQAQTDAYQALSISGRSDDEDGKAIDSLFQSMPERKKKDK